MGGGGVHPRRETPDCRGEPQASGRGARPLPPSARISDLGGWGAQKGSLVPFAGELMFLQCR